MEHLVLKVLAFDLAVQTIISFLPSTFCISSLQKAKLKVYQIQTQLDVSLTLAA